MTQILDILNQLCSQEGWDITELDDGESMIEFKEEDNIDWSCFAYTREKQHQFVFYSIAFEDVPQDKISTVVEFVTRFNYGISIGNFEINIDKGTLRYKTSLDFDKTTPTTDLMAPLIYANTTTFGKFLPILEDLIAGNTSPLEAVNRAKNQQSTASR